MEFKSTAGRRQFEQTAIKKLMAEGVPHHVASAFVMVGIQKSGRYEQLRDSVCRMEFKKFFVAKTAADFADPSRLGAMVPRVVESRMPKFHAEFSMSDIEAVKFIKTFPEFEVIPRGKTFNPHGFYANKRYAECELLVAMVYRHSARTGGVTDPTSLVDLGGNDVWHSKRGRHAVHCENPVLSYRDVMRYTVREIFSGSDRSAVCDKKFQDCTHRAQYGIGVHSTYDVTPKAIAMAMMRRGMKGFFGVINVIPGLDPKRPGVFEVDGIVATVVRPPREPPYVKYTFSHDPSLEYKHRFATLRKYLYTHRRYEFVSKSGEVSTYVYSIHSVRGNSLVFQILEGEDEVYTSDAIWTPPSRRLYYISMKMLGVNSMEVDSEYFDRLVLQAASARNIDTYDIVSLFRYGKSLRQRISINGIVLSSGYTQNPEEMVLSTIAAYTVAAAFRLESKQFFKEASSQIIDLRGRGFFRDVFTIGGALIWNILGAVPTALASVTGLKTLNEKIKRLVASASPVSVVVDKPHYGHGAGFHKSMLRPLDQGKPSRALVKSGLASAGGLSPLIPGGFSTEFVNTTVLCKGERMTFASYGVPSLDPSEMPTDSNPVYHGVDIESGGLPYVCEEYRNLCYGHLHRRLFQVGAYEDKPVVLMNGDRLYRKSQDSVTGRELSSPDRVFVGPDTHYVVFRGVGPKAVALSPPKCYSRGSCVRFVLFYVKSFTEDELASFRKDLPPEAYQLDSTEVAVTATGQIYELRGDEPDWNDVEPSPPPVVKVEGEEEGRLFVQSAAQRGQYYMSGALPVGEGGRPDSPPSTEVTVSPALGPIKPLRDGCTPNCWRTTRVGDKEVLVHDPLCEAVLDPDEIRVLSEIPLGFSTARPVTIEEQSGSSSSAEHGAAALDEFLTYCGKSEQIAAASAKQTMEMAISVAQGEAPMVRWKALVQGVPGNPKPVRVTGECWEDACDGTELDGYMAVSDGESVYDRITKPPPDGLYVTSDVMYVYTGAAIRESVAAVKDETYSCEVTCLNGVAGSGKTYTIKKNVQPGDVVLCETTYALQDTAADLAAIPWWRGYAWTVDSFLMHKPLQSCDRLWIDEAFRLHAAKIYALMRMLKPKVVYCFGDDKQIPALPYIPGMDFAFHEFPWSRVKRVTDTWRSPADVCVATSTKQFYGFHVRTHNPVMRSVKKIVQFEQGMFHKKPDEVPVLVYTKVAKKDLVESGVKNVMTIGESQGKTLPRVIIFRDSTLNKYLYYSAEQTLVGLTRHKLELSYVTASSLLTDDSRMAKCIVDMFTRGSDIVYAAHIFSGVRPVADADALRAREAQAAVRKIHLFPTGLHSATTSPEFSAVSDVEDVEDVSVISDWAEHMNEISSSGS